MTTLTATTADPADLLIDRNIRDCAPDKKLLDSVRTHGILVPIVCLQDGDALRVRDGHRRTLAALDVGLPEIPVIVADTDPTDPARIVAQYAINEHRAGLSDTERLDAWSQLAAFGICAADIATKTGEKKATVTAALSLADLPAAAHALVKQTLTLEEAAELAEFSDNPDTIDELITAAEHGNFSHAIGRKRNERDLGAAVAELSETLQGERLQHLQPNERATARPLHQLRHHGQHIDEHAHTECPGHCFDVHSFWDWTQDDDGRHVHTPAARATIWCRDWASHGHTDSWARTGSAGGATDPEQLKAKRRHRRHRGPTTRRRFYVARVRSHDRRNRVDTACAGGRRSWNRDHEGEPYDVVLLQHFGFGGLGEQVGKSCVRQRCKLLRRCNC